MTNKKLHRVGNSKEPTVSQMLRMAENLNNKLGIYSTVVIDVVGYNGKAVVLYRIYTEKTGWSDFNEWADCLAYYRKLMKEGI